MDERRPPTEANRQKPINAAWLEDVKNRADTFLHRKPPSEPTIFRVPPSMRCANLPAYEYEPKLVSIGPYHRGKSMNLKATEELKWRLLHNYLSGDPNESRNEGLRKMKDLELRARSCYSEVINLDSDQFVEMLLLDGCFLVQIFTEPDEELKSLLCENMWFRGLVFRDLFLLENQLPYFILEHLLDTLMPGWNRSDLQQVVIDWFTYFLPRPMPNLPNQCFQVDHLLHLFHKWIVETRNTRSACELDEAKNTRSYSCSNYLSKVLPCCNSSSLSEELPPPVPNEPVDQEFPPPVPNEPAGQELSPSIPTMTRLVEAGVKILEETENTRSCSCSVHHYIRNWYSITNNYLSKVLPCCNNYLSKVLPCCNCSDQELPLSIPTMTELVEAGVKICKVREAKSFLDISFCKDKGVLEIPAICVDDHTNFFFANLIAWEQSSREHCLHVTHYTMFLDDIINTPIDVELLHKKGIIHRDLGSNEDIASLFNELGNGVTYNSATNYLGDVRKDLNVYCQSRCSRWRAKAKRDYFNNPWAIISLVAAFLLLVFSFLQSVYAILQYYKK